MPPLPFKELKTTPWRRRPQTRATNLGGSSPKSQRPSTRAIAGIWNETSLMPPAAGTTTIGAACSATSMTATAGDAGCARGRRRSRARAAQIEHRGAQGVRPVRQPSCSARQRGKAEPGSLASWRTMPTRAADALHKIDNLQARGPHLLQQTQGQHPRGRQVAAPGHAAAHGRGRCRRGSLRVALEACD